MWKECLASELKNIKSSDRKSIIEDYMQKTGLSRARLYNIAKQHGFDSNKKERADKGNCVLTDRQIEFIAAQLHVTRREVKGPIKPVEAALETAFDNGIIERGRISVGRMQQILREREINKIALKIDRPYTPMCSLHPNHVHVFDVSVCIQYYLKGGLKIMDERDFYKNKLDKYLEIKTRLLRYLIVDHFSGEFFPYYYEAKGENQKNLYDFLMRAWRPKEDNRFPFRGVPFQLLMDAGAANGAGAIVQFLERLGVEVPKGKPYNAARQGTVETMHNIWEAWFEADLRLQPAHTIEDVNAWSLDKAIWYNATRKHTRHGMTRSQCWQLIKAKEQLRDLPSEDILHALFYYKKEAFTRLVNRDYTISYNGKIYNLKHIEDIIPGHSKVIITIYPFLADQGIIGIEFKQKQYEVKVIEMLPAHLGSFRSDAAIIGQQYKSQPETLTQQAVKRFENMAYGENKKKDSIPFEGIVVHGIHADKVGNLAFIEKKGTPIEVDKSIMVKDISFTEFLKRLLQQVGPISKELNQHLRQEFGESIEITKAEEVIREIEAIGQDAWLSNRGQQEGNREAIAG